MPIHTSVRLESFRSLNIIQVLSRCCEVEKGLDMEHEH